ncbi:MAG: thioredoxin [Bacillota bacterium]|nr:thioredoxin [Bacillota bacterium]
MIKEAQDLSFNEEINGSDVPVVVDFWAPWCGPCKMLGPVIEELSNELDGKVKFLKVNVDDNPVTSQTYKIASIPTVMVFKGGNVVETLVGFRPKQAIQQMVEKHI